MGIIDKLGSSRRVLAVLQSALSEPQLRLIARQYNIDVPGFRQSEAPPALLARGISTAVEQSPELRRELNRRLNELATPAGRALSAMSESDAENEIGRLGSQSRHRAIGLLLAGLMDSRSVVATKANDRLNALDSGRLRLIQSVVATRDSRVGPQRAREDRFRPAPPPRRTYSSGPSLDDLERTLAEREQQLRELRLECTRQEQKMQRLRSQLETERETHERTKRQLEEARVTLGRVEDPRAVLAVANVSGEVDHLRALQLTTKLQLDVALRDCELLANGARVLESMIESLLQRSSSHEDPKPQRPSRVSTASPDGKVRLPIEGEHWPKHLHSFLHRLAGSEYVEQIQLLDYSKTRPTRILLEIPDSALLAQFSDGDRAARFLILTTAASPASLHWVRRHLAETCFPAT
jgi:hypothetical protein